MRGKMAAYKEFTVFVGWSGQKEIPRRLYRFLKDFFGDCLKVAFSEDIPAGEVWHTELAEFLREANFAIMCVTLASRPTWLLYESGALSLATLQEETGGKPYIVPVLFGLDSAVFQKNFGPLSHYQAVAFDYEEDSRSNTTEDNEDKVWDLLQQINSLSKNRQSAYLRNYKESYPAQLRMENRYLKKAEFEKNFSDLYPAFSRDIRRMLGADIMDAHLDALEKDPYYKPVGRDSFVRSGREFTRLLRQETAKAAQQQYHLERIQSTLKSIVDENGYTAILKDLNKDVKVLGDLL